MLGHPSQFRHQTRDVTQTSLCHQGRHMTENIVRDHDIPHRRAFSEGPNRLVNLRRLCCKSFQLSRLPRFLQSQFAQLSQRESSGFGYSELIALASSVVDCARRSCPNEPGVRDAKHVGMSGVPLVADAGVDTEIVKPIGLPVGAFVPKLRHATRVSSQGNARFRHRTPAFCRLVGSFSIQA